MYYYKSVETGEITDDRSEARSWYERNGESIEMHRYADHKIVTIWRHT